MAKRSKQMDPVTIAVIALVILVCLYYLNVKEGFQTQLPCIKYHNLSTCNAHSCELQTKYNSLLSTCNVTTANLSTCNIIQAKMKQQLGFSQKSLNITTAELSTTKQQLDRSQIALAAITADFSTCKGKLMQYGKNETSK